MSQHVSSALLHQDSRLLAEIHIALLNLIIKDIEEGARTPSGGAGTNQYTVANPEGGHPHLVEGVRSSVQVTSSIYPYITAL